MANRKAQDKLIVVKHKPGIKRKRRLMFITGLVVIGAACFWLGEFQSRYMHKQTLATLNSLSIEIKENLNLILDASKNIITHSIQCTDIVEDTTEKIEITELSAQFVSHFVSTIETDSVTRLFTAKTN